MSAWVGYYWDRRPESPATPRQKPQVSYVKSSSEIIFVKHNVISIISNWIHKEQKLSFSHSVNTHTHPNYMCWYWLKISLLQMKWSINQLLLPPHAQRKNIVYNFVYIWSWTPFTADLLSIRRNTSILLIYFTCQSVYVCMCVCVSGHLYATDDSISVLTKWVTRHYIFKKMHLIVKFFLIQHEFPQKKTSNTNTVLEIPQVLNILSSTNGS